MSSQFRLKCLFGTASLFSFQEEVAQVLKTKFKKKKMWKWSGKNETGTSSFDKSKKYPWKKKKKRGFIILVAGGVTAVLFPVYFLQPSYKKNKQNKKSCMFAFFCSYRTHSCLEKESL